MIEGGGLGGGGGKTYSPNIFHAAQVRMGKNQIYIFGQFLTIARRFSLHSSQNHHYSSGPSSPNSPDSQALNVDAYPPSCGEGEALYLGLKTTFLLTSTIYSLSIPSLTSTCFQGLHEVIQHCAMWCSGAASLCMDVMKAWEELFSAVATIHGGEGELKKESLSTLCKVRMVNN